MPQLLSPSIRPWLAQSAMVTLALSIGVILVAGCDDPTKGQAKATAAAAVASAAEVQTGTTYTVTPQNSKVEWTGSKVTGSHDGSFTSFSGGITLVGGAVEKSRVTVDIDTPSIQASPDNLVKHLKSPDFFGVEQFP